MLNWKKLVKQIPHRIQVKKNVFYEILWIDQFPDKETVAETRKYNKQIVIKKGLSPKLTIICYLHELAHCFSDEYGANFTENQILVMEKSLYFLLKNGNIFTKD